MMSPPWSLHVVSGASDHLSVDFPVDLGYGRQTPSAVDDRGPRLLRPVHAQHRDEPAVGRRQPVGLPSLIRRAALDDQVDGPVLIVLQLVAGADLSFINSSGNLPTKQT